MRIEVLVSTSDCPLWTCIKVLTEHIRMYKVLLFFEYDFSLLLSLSLLCTMLSLPCSSVFSAIVRMSRLCLFQLPYFLVNTTSLFSIYSVSTISLSLSLIQTHKHIYSAA